MKYQRIVDYLHTLANYEQTTGHSYHIAFFNLNRMKKLLDFLDNPQKNLKVIHIAGTKGKGSTATILESLLRKAGFKTGLYTSPHIFSFRERIKYNGREISLSTLAKLIKRVKKAADKLRKTKYGMSTFFEFYTAIAFLYFKDKDADYVILEAGLGGRLDATNVAESVICGITPISLDHTKELGNTTIKIAKEKMKIIKNNSIVVNANQDRQINALLKNYCKKKRASYYEINKGVKYKVLKTSIKGTEFFYSSDFRKDRFFVPLIGKHQALNASMAIAMFDLLIASVLQGKRPWSMGAVKNEIIQSGLKSVEIKGRLEVVRRRSFVIFDVAHNVASARVLKEAIKQAFKYRKLFVVLGMASNKDIKGFGKEIASITDTLIITRSHLNPRSAKPEYIRNVVSKYFKKYTTAYNIKEALKYATTHTTSKDLILITGSFYLVSEAKRVIHKYL